MAIIREDGAIVVRKKENGKTKLKHFENMDELIRKMNCYDEECGRFEFEPTNCDLSGLDFSNAEFTAHENEYTGEIDRIRFDGSDLSNCSFHNSDRIYRCTFADVKIDGADFSNTYWEGSSLNGIKGKNVNFENCSFNEIHLNEAEFTDSSFKNTAFWKVQMNRSKFIDCNLEISDGGGHCGLRDADISGSSINENFSDFAFLPNLKTDHIKGTPKAIQSLHKLQEEHNKEYIGEKAEKEKMMKDPQAQALIAQFRAMGIEIDL